MLSPFFVQAAVAPGRQRALRYLTAVHLLALAVCFRAAAAWQAEAAPRVGLLLLVAGIIAGALLVGWRLTQLPKSQALEFLLVSSLRPWQVFLGEAAVGLARLALVTLAGLPVLLLLVLEGRLSFLDLPPLLAVPWTWGAVTGLGLAVWAYEPRAVRKWGERGILGLVVVYLLVGVLAGEHLQAWLGWLPAGLGAVLMDGFRALHTYNPFAMLEDTLRRPPGSAWGRLLTLEAAALAGAGVLLARAAGRLRGHFQERHYRPVLGPTGRDRGRPGDRPLAWWAVRRVTEYSGRVNLYLAGGFGLLYAAYTLAGPAWPAWLGREVFAVFERLGGIPALAAALVVLAAVPAAFQYGLWDASAQDRCRRLELLLLTRLEARDYWEAAAAAAWRRGRGYFAVAVLLWAAAAAAGRVEPVQALAALAAGVILWALYFAVGFRAFSRGLQANGLGLLLTLGLPLVAYALYQGGWPLVAALVPPGSVYHPGAAWPTAAWLPGPALGAALALGTARFARRRCDAELRRWYDRHHGRKLLD
jgi:hypothetical protein